MASGSAVRLAVGLSTALEQPMSAQALPQIASKTSWEKRFMSSYLVGWWCLFAAPAAELGFVVLYHLSSKLGNFLPGFSR
jgi:hypothetical protein